MRPMGLRFTANERIGRPAATDAAMRRLPGEPFND